MLFTGRVRLLYCVALAFISGCATSPPPKEAIHANQNLVPLTTQTADKASVDGRPEDRLISAAARGDRDAVQDLLNQGVAVDCFNRDQWTPFLAALRHGHHSLAEMLIDAGADIHRQQADRWTAMHMICRYGDQNPDLARRLLEKGCDKEARTLDGWTPLMLASCYGNQKIVRLLIEHGADPNVKNNDQWTPLLLAMRSNHDEIAKLLIAEGADVNANSIDYWTPLLLLSRYGIDKTELAKMLLDRGADPNLRNGEGYSPLHFAAKGGNHVLIQLLLEHDVDVEAKTNGRETALAIAVQNKHADAAILLWRSSYDRHLGRRYNKKIIKAVKTNDTEALETLQEKKGAAGKFKRRRKGNRRERAHQRKNRDWTLLHTCARFGNAELAKKLIRKGAKVDVRDNLGWTPLHLAVRYGHKDTGRLLHKIGADVKVKDKYGWTPLHHAAVLPDTELLSRFLFQDRAMVDRKEKLTGATPLFLAIRWGSEKAVNILLGKGADPNISDKEGNSPLHIAAGLGRHSIVRRLIRHRAKIQICNKQKMTPLHLAATNKEAKVATLLLDQKADIDAVNKDGATPLHMAAFHGSAENVKLLLDRGASVKMRTAIGHSALNLAAIASGDNGAIIELLLNAGDKVCDVEGAPDHTAAAHEAVGRHHAQKGRTSAAAESLRHAVASYDRAIAYFEEEIKSLETKETLRQTAVVMLSVLAMALDSYNAKLQADQFAELSALSQASRSGAGYGGYFSMLHQTRSLVQIHQPLLATYQSGFWGLPSISQNSPAASQSASFQQKVSVIKDKIANCRLSTAQCRQRLAKLESGVFRAP